MYPAFAAALLDETGIDIELETTGTLYLALTEHDAEELQKRYEWQTKAGLPIEKLGAAAVRQLEPAINEDVRLALKFPLDTQVENRRLISALDLWAPETAAPPQIAGFGRSQPDSVAGRKKAPGQRFRWSGALLCTGWQVKDSNLRSFRDGFTVHSHWPLGQPALVRVEG